VPALRAVYSAASLPAVFVEIELAEDGQALIESL
jgi:hypothetical protein